MACHFGKDDILGAADFLAIRVLQETKVLVGLDVLLNQFHDATVTVVYKIMKSLQRNCSLTHELFI